MDKHSFTPSIEPELTVQHPKLKTLNLEIGDIFTLIFDEVSTFYVVTSIGGNTLTARKANLAGQTTRHITRLP